MRKPPPPASVDACAELSGEFTRADVEALAARGNVAQLTLERRDTPLTEPVARGLAALDAVEVLHLRCEAARAALRHVFALPRLRELNGFGIVGPGRLSAAATAPCLEVLRISGLTEADLLNVARSRTLRELFSHGAAVTPRVVDALAAMPRLESLDIEDCRFDDAMAERLAASTTLASLWICNTRVTGRGLASLARLRQLRALDLWMTKIAAGDLALLAAFGNLETISLGSYGGDPDALRGRDVVPALRRMRRLKTVWLDGVVFNPSQRGAIEKRYPNVRIT